jgi:hypothetical protein
MAPGTTRSQCTLHDHYAGPRRSHYVPGLVGDMRHLIGRLDDPAALRACDEAGACGLELHRLLAQMGIACDVVAPSPIPRQAWEYIVKSPDKASWPPERTLA